MKLTFHSDQLALKNYSAVKLIHCGHVSLRSEYLFVCRCRRAGILSPAPPVLTWRVHDSRSPERDVGEGGPSQGHLSPPEEMGARLPKTVCFRWVICSGGSSDRV